MPRYFIDISYLGTAFHGWQIQPNAISVQQVLNERISKLLRQPIEVTGSGRTDTNVHCRRQFAHFDGEIPFSENDFVHKINSFLPETVSVNSIRKVNPEAHARFDATKRTYIYRAHVQKDPFSNGLSWEVRKQPDLNTMNKAASYMLGSHDFEMFCKTHSGNKTNNCIIYTSEWRQSGNHLEFEISADRFLRGMVRFTVGHLMAVGMGTISANDFAKVISEKKRHPKISLAPAEGLYLYCVEYPDHIWIK